MKGQRRTAPRRGSPGGRPARPVLPRDRLERPRPGPPGRPRASPGRRSSSSRSRSTRCARGGGGTSSPRSGGWATPTSSPRPWSASPRGSSSPARASCCAPGSSRGATRSPRPPGFATIILERLVDLITVLVLFALYLFVLPAPGGAGRGPAHGPDQARRGGSAGVARPRSCSPSCSPSTRTRSAWWARSRGCSPARRAGWPSRSAASSRPSRRGSPCCAPRSRTSRRSPRSRSSSGC